MDNLLDTPVVEAWQLLPGDILPVPDTSDLFMVSRAIMRGDNAMHIFGANMICRAEGDFICPAGMPFHIWERV